MAEWKTVRSQYLGTVHYAPRVYAEAWMVDRVTLCWPRGSRKAWFEDCDGVVTCTRCIAIGKREG